MERELRKAKSDLKLCGVGAMIFGVWLFLKSILYNLFAKDYMTSLMQINDMDLSDRNILMLGLFIFYFVVMLVHLYVGLRSVQDAGDNAKHRRFYLIVAALLLIADAAIIPADIINERETTPPFDLACELVFELVRVVNLAFLLAAAYKVRKLSVKEEKESAPDAD